MRGSPMAAVGDVAEMNYESSDLYTLPGAAAPSRTRWYVIGAIALLVLALVGAFAMMRPRSAVGNAARATTPEEQLPPVTVSAPGSNVIARAIPATG